MKINADKNKIGNHYKVIILNGSPKAHGNTAMALHEVECTLQQQGIDTEWIHVGHLQVHGCIACNKCWDTGDCTFGDIVNEISKKMLGAFSWDPLYQIIFYRPCAVLTAAWILAVISRGEGTEQSAPIMICPTGPSAIIWRVISAIFSGEALPISPLRLNPPSTGRPNNL